MNEQRHIYIYRSTDPKNPGYRWCHRPLDMPEHTDALKLEAISYVAYGGLYGRQNLVDALIEAAKTAKIELKDLSEVTRPKS